MPKPAFVPLGLVFIASLSCLYPAFPTRADDLCGPLLDHFRKAIKTGNLETMVAAGEQVRNGLDCAATTRSTVGRRLALAHVAEAQRLARDGLTDLDQLRVLKAGLRFAQPWQLLAFIGDLTQKIRGPDGRVDYAAASRSYQAALAAISDSGSTPVPPEQAEIKRLIQLATQTRSLASTFVPGDSVLKRDVRGVAIEAAPVPVEFVFDRAELTDLGRRYAEETAQLLLSLGRPTILLVGHTDPKGTEAYNDRLSLQRAQALKSILVASGYDARSINVKGLGKRAPREIQTPQNYTQEQIHQMLRRVEVCFMDRPNSVPHCK